MNFNVFLENSGPFSLTPWLFVSSGQLSVLPGGSCKLPVHVSAQQNCRDPRATGSAVYQGQRSMRVWILVLEQSHQSLTLGCAVPSQTHFFPFCHIPCYFSSLSFQRTPNPSSTYPLPGKSGQVGRHGLSGSLCLVSYFFVCFWVWFCF